MSLTPSVGYRLARERTSPWLLRFDAGQYGYADPNWQPVGGTSRTTGTTVYDSDGRLVTLVSKQPSWGAAYNSDTGLYESVVYSGNGTTNRCLRSEDFGTTWAAVGTPTRTAAALQCGDLVLDLIGDDAAGTLEGYTQTVTFTGNAAKAVSVFVAQGTSTSSVIRLRDTTAGADRLLARLQWSGGAPSVTMSTGTYIGATPCYGGVYRLQFQTTSVTAANTNSVQVYPATTAALAIASTGTLYCGGVQCENALWPRAYLKTVGSVATSDYDGTPATATWAPQDFTLYARLQRPAWADMSGTLADAGICYIGSGSGAGFDVRFLAASRTIQAQLMDDAAATVTKTASVPAGGFIEVCAQFATVRAGGTITLDVGGGFGSASSAAGTITGAYWSGSTLHIGALGAASSIDAGVRAVHIAAGAKTLSEMRGAIG